jgi:hypothetical protein
MKMDPKYKKLWLAALRGKSGRVLQCREAMRIVDNESHERFCLLGLLAEIVREENPGKFFWVYTCVQDDDSVVYNLRCSNDGMQHPEDWDWLVIAGLSEGGELADATLDYLGEELQIMTLNDDFGVTFKEAAPLIAEQL